MIKVFIAFAVLTTAIAVGMTIWRDLQGKERWEIFKTFGFGAICASIAIAILSVIVILF